MSESASISEWFSSATDFKGRYAEFQNLLTQLKTAKIDPKKYPVLFAEQQKLIADGDKTLAKIKDTVSGVESLYTGVKDAVGGYATAAANWAKSLFSSGEVSGLGFFPALVPLAVIGASAAAVTYWVTDAQNFQAKIAEQKRLEAMGVPPAQASQMVEKTFSSGVTKLFSGAFDLGKISSVLGILFLAYKFMNEYRRGKNDPA